MASTLYAETAEHPAHVPSGLSVTDLLLLCMALIWGVNFIVVKFATGIFAPLAFNSTRIVVALVVLWPLFLLRRQPLPSSRDIIGMLMLGALGNGLYQILWVEGMARTRASDAALLVAASPAVIEILGWFRGGERVGKRGIAGIAISLFGIGLVVSAATNGGSGSSTFAGNGLILASVLCWAFYSVGLKPYTEHVDGLTLSAITMTGGVVPMLVAAAPSLLATNWGAVSMAGWGAVAYSGLLALVVAYLFWYRGVRMLGPTRASMYSNLQPLFAIAAAWAFLGESPRALQLAGAACIVGGLLLTRLPGRTHAVCPE
ncbi:MAG: DMT family transporter [Gemmatimonadaceae bacterium]